MSKICPNCKTEVLVPSEEMRNKVGDISVCDDCYYESLGQVVELPFEETKPRIRRAREKDKWSDNY